MKNIFLFLSFVSVLSHSSELLSVYLKPELKYKDIDVSCHYGPGGRNLSLTAEVEAGQVIKARLRKKKSSDQSLYLDLNEEEMGGLDLFYSNGSQAYGIKSFTVSERVLLFLLYEAYGPEKPCVTKELVSGVEPSQFTFLFRNPYSLEEKIPYELYSNLGVFKGTNQLGKPFRIEFSLLQSQ